MAMFISSLRPQQQCTTKGLRRSLGAAAGRQEPWAAGGDICKARIGAGPPMPQWRGAPPCADAVLIEAATAPL